MALPRDATPNDNTVTFDESRLTSEKPSFEKSRSSSRSRYDSELEGPNGIVTRNNSDVAPDEDMPQALRTLSVASEPAAPVAGESKWPQDKRAYLAWFGGFLLMCKSTCGNAHNKPLHWPNELCMLTGPIAVNSWGIVNAYGTYMSYYRQHLMPNSGNTQLNLIGSTQCFCILLLSMVVGRFIDAGYQRVVISIGTILIILGQFLLTVCVGLGERGHGEYALIWTTQGLLSGLGMACYFVTSSAVAASWHKTTKSFCIGVVASGASIAGLVYPIMLKFLIAQIGFKKAQLAVAGLIAALSILAVFIAIPNPASAPRKPETWKGWFQVRIFWDKHAFRNPSFCWFTASIAWLFLGFYPIFFSLEEWAGARGLGRKDETPGGFRDVSLAHEVPRQDAIRTFYMLAIMNGCSTVGRMGSGWLSDKFGALNVHCVVTFVSSLLVLAVWTTANSVAHAMIFVIVFGMISGAVIGLPPASIAWVLGIHDPIAQQKLGQWVGMMYTMAAVPALTGPIISGYLITEYNTYLTVQLWAGICLFLSACCMLMAIFYADRSRAKEWAAAGRRRFSSATGSLFLSKTRSGAVSEKEQV